MVDAIFSHLEQLNDFIWAHAAFVLIVGLGSYFTAASRFFQVRQFGPIIRSFSQYFGEKTGGVGQPKVRPFATPPVRKKRAAHQKSPPPVQPAAVTARPGADGRAGWLGLDGPADWPHGGDGREAVEKPP